MPPRVFSRYQFCDGLVTPTERLFLSDRTPYLFQSFEDNRQHIVTGGETLGGLASRYFEGIADPPDQLWWIIADFQPEPIFDPTLLLDEGRVLQIPSIRTVREVIFNENRRGL